MSLNHIGIFFVVFSAIWGIVTILPALYETLHERYQTNVKRTTRELDKFFLNVKPVTIIVIIGAVGGVIGLISGSWVFAMTIAGSGVFAPKVMLAIWKDIRSRKVEAQLMDALIILGNSLKSGMDIVAGIERVTADMKPPISEEFGLVLNAYRLGTPIETGLMDMTQRIRSRTLETVVYAITIQRETGGNIIKIFDQLVFNIREESKLQKKVQAITSQARTQIVFLAAFPWVLAGLFAAMAPEFMKPALANPWGQVILVFLIFWEIIGIFVTRKITAVDV